MENCLVTKLKATVNNPDLMKIGELDVSLPAGQSIKIADSWVKAPITVSIKSGTATAVDHNNQPLQFPDTIINGNMGRYHTYTATTNCVLCITKVYDFQILNAGSGYWDIDVEAFKYSPIIEFNKGEEAVIHGDIKYVYKLGNTQTSIYIGYSNNENKLYGDISVFGNCVSLTSLNIYYQRGIKGSIESMVNKYRENGRTTGSMSVTFPPTIITFNGESGGTGSSSKTLKWKPTETSIAGAVTDICFNNVAIAIDVNGNKVGNATPW